jgi:hypothetical protein
VSRALNPNVDTTETPNQCAAANPAIASRLQSWRPTGRVAELGSLGSFSSRLPSIIRCVNSAQNTRFPLASITNEIVVRRLTRDRIAIATRKAIAMREGAAQRTITFCRPVHAFRTQRHRFPSSHPWPRAYVRGTGPSFRSLPILRYIDRPST